jgi:hypothetical protein
MQLIPTKIHLASLQSNGACASLVESVMFLGQWAVADHPLELVLGHSDHHLVKELSASEIVIVGN